MAVTHLSRRQFVKAAGLGAASLAFGGALSGCGSGTTTSPDTPEADQVIVTMTTTDALGLQATLQPGGGIRPALLLGLWRARP